MTLTTSSLVPHVFDEETKFKRAKALAEHGRTLITVLFQVHPALDWCEQSVYVCAIRVTGQCAHGSRQTHST